MAESLMAFSNKPFSIHKGKRHFRYDVRNNYIMILVHFIKLNNRNIPHTTFGYAPFWQRGIDNFEVDPNLTIILHDIIIKFNVISFHMVLIGNGSISTWLLLSQYKYS